jgi:hypothetical protein
MWFEIVIMFQSKMKNLTKYVHFLKFIFIQKWLTQNINLENYLTKFF